MKLGHLPSEILGCILNPLENSFLFLRLWKCGNHILNRKLSLAITSVDLRHSDLVTSQYPRALSELSHLRHLSMISPYTLISNTGSWSIEVDKLSQTLESLFIDSTDQKSYLLNYDPKSTLDCPCYIRTQYARGVSRMIDLGSLFPSLRTLKIGEENDPLELSDFAALPPTLTYLATPRLCISIDKPVLMAYLPSSLQTLDSEVFIEFAKSSSSNQFIFDDWAHPPPHLELIRRLWFSNGPLHWNWLPRTLQRAWLSETAGGMDWTLTRALSAPPLLKELEITGVDHDSFDSVGKDQGNDSSHISHLPTTLEILRISRPIPLPINLLPRSLTSLNLKFCVRRQFYAVGDSVNLPSLWPPKLTHIKADTPQLDGLVSILPYGLQKLDLRVTPGKPTFDAALLPRTLTDLRITSRYPFINLEIVQRWPPALTKAYLSNGKDHHRIRDLPDSLTSLTLHSSFRPDAPEHTPFSFPSKLTELEIPWCYATAFESLPRTLIRLNVAQSIIDIESSGSSGDIFATLPATLEYLRLETHLPNDFFIPMPPTLSALSFSTLHRLEELWLGQNFARFPSAVLRVLPRALKILSIALSCLLEQDAPYIPRLLERLE